MYRLLLVVALVACSERATVCGDRCAIDAAVDAPIDGEPDAGPESTQCSPWVIGDASLPIELEPVRVGGSGLMAVLDDDDVMMSVPPQGGIIVLAGVRAKNVDGCAAQVTGSVRDLDTGRVIGLDDRPGSLYDSVDGWATPTSPAFASLPNIAVCPNASAGRDVFDARWRLEFTVTDGARTATVARAVVLRCPPPSLFGDCRCLCAADYQPGTCPTGGNGRAN